MTQKEKLIVAEAKLKAVERLIPDLERNRSTIPIGKRLRAILELPDQKGLFS